MRRKVSPFSILVLSITGACAVFSQPAVAVPKYRITDIVNSGIKLTVDSSVYIQVPKDGSYGGKPYQGSGQSAAEATRAAFAHHVQKVALAGDNSAPVEKLIADAAATGYSNFCELEILHWEDRATEWSGKRDKIEIKMTIYDTANGKVVRSAIFQGFSKFWTFGGDHPQDIVAAHTRVLVDSLF